MDLLEAKDVSWSEYQEDSPYSGFEGNYVNQKTGANDYVRKHKYFYAHPRLEGLWLIDLQSPRELRLRDFRYRSSCKDQEFYHV